MKKVMMAVLVLLIGMPMTSFADGNIAGEIVCKDYSSKVYILDATNALIIKTVTTDSAGLYDTGPLPSGDYKVRYESSYCNVEYYGAGWDSFDLGSTVTVQQGQTTVVSAYPKPSDSGIPVWGYLWLYGTITDASNGMPLAGIKVSLVDPFNAMPLYETSSDTTGNYYFTKLVVTWAGVKARFSAPDESYLPQYAGAGNQDIFSLGVAVPPTPKYELSVAMTRLTPSVAIDNTINDISSSGLSSSTITSMTQDLNRAKDIVTDANPNNDVAACGILSSTINKINAMQNSGRLSAFEADALKQSLETSRTTIGCK